MHTYSVCTPDLCIIIFYNHQACRVDVIMYPHDADDMGFAVTFEPGRPDYTVRQPFD